MSYFRHAPLAYWAVALIALVALLAIGVNQSSRYSPVLAVPASGSNSAEQAAYELAAEVSGVNVSFMSGDADGWAADFARQVRVADALYQSTSADRSPALDSLWANVVDTAGDLSAYRGDDPMKRQQLSSQLSTAVFALAYQYRQQ